MSDDIIASGSSAPDPVEEDPAFKDLLEEAEAFYWRTKPYSDDHDRFVAGSRAAMELLHAWAKQKYAEHQETMLNPPDDPNLEPDVLSLLYEGRTLMCEEFQKELSNRMKELE